MLTALHIENFAIVSKLELSFHQGMTAFTGETGAGKSIMIDALMLALGGRGDSTVVRTGAEKCDITACFVIEPNTPPSLWLNENDIPCESGEILLRRVLYTEGRSKSYINGQLLPLQKIKALSEMLVDIHGQHQHQTLLNHQTHRQQLDQYAHHSALQDAVQTAYHQCKTIQAELDACQAEQASEERIALLQYQIEELEQLQLETGEMQLLHEEHRLLHHAQDYLDRATRVSLLLQDDESFTISQGIHSVLSELSALPQEQEAVKNALELMNNALIQCDEALDEMHRFTKQVQLDPERLQVVESRMSLLHQMARKYHTDPNQLLETLNALQASLNVLQRAGSEQVRLEQAYLDAKQAYEAAAMALRASRQAHAAKLAEAISEKIRQLGMPKGYIELLITPLEKMHAHGMDKVEYHVCTNPGMPSDTLGKVASGGELSRISLAIQMVTAQRGCTPTLLFDEVDVGIGGATAALVGQMLRALGARLQLFCVTHQPQVASCAHSHFRVEKYIEGETTFSRVTLLDAAEKVNEIARMLGGLVITDQTRNHARELLEVV